MFFESDSQPGQQVRRLRKEEVWRKVKYLGEGGFGSVWLEQCPTTGSQPKSRAVKAIPKVSTLSLTIDYKRELEAIAKFSQAKVGPFEAISRIIINVRQYDGFFVRSFGWYEDAKLAYITMEYFELGDLQKHLWRPIPEQETQQVVHQLLEGLEQLHMNGFAHRDLKPANIFVVKKGPDWWVKIGDFGISKRVHDGTTSLRTLIGTPGFIAPEVLENDGSDLSYTCKVDMWSLGVITHYMITATLPFDEQPKLRRYTKDGHFPSAALVCSDVSQECHDFIINGLMATAAATRLSASDALQHRWLNHLCKTQGMVSTSKTAIASLESTEASAKWSALNGTEYQPSGRTALQMHTEQKGEAYLSLGPASMQAMHGQGKTIEQINIEITSIIQNGRSLYRQDRYKEAENPTPQLPMMAELGLALSLIGTIDICLKYGAKVIEKYKHFKEAQTGIEERITSIEATWAKISQQLRFLQSIWDSLDEDYRDLQGRVLRILQRKLDGAVTQISKLEKRSQISSSGQEKWKAAKYALEVKKTVDAAIQDLQIWQREFDPTWYLVMRVADLTIDQSLVKTSNTDTLSFARHVRGALQEEPQRKASIFLPENQLSCAQRSKIPFSTFEVIDIPGLNTFIIDSVEFEPRKDASIFVKDIRRLAQKLQQVDSFQFNLPNCLGVVRMKDHETQKYRSFNFIFRIPNDHHKPQSLRNNLYETNYSLNDRIDLAKQLATSVSYLHTLDFVHKGIRPETVLIFQGIESYHLQLSLMGFKTFRTADGRTMRLGNSERAEDIYQHPERQGISPVADYIMQHDIYSLGVCLLEIGLWESLVARDGHINLPSVNAKLDSSTVLKDYFTTIAGESLPMKMGDKYAQVVISCLTCLDDTNDDFGDPSQFEDEDGILIGVKYIEKV
ncbi:HET-s/LopB domain protein [Talaromyces pinophilus]|uniref:HET-s/LopB domain protein n=1 Tax=Talaromyces pinophilus TaxID=128442 RepID=A0A6V8HQ17_TALPI|nr:HET-s/LopB domain protein [Talaromyces pinophilus]